MIELNVYGHKIFLKVNKFIIYRLWLNDGMFFLNDISVKDKKILIFLEKILKLILNEIKLILF